MHSINKFILKIPKGVLFSIIGAFVIYAGAKGWLGEQEMTLLSAVLASCGIGLNQYTKALHGNKK